MLAPMLPPMFLYGRLPVSVGLAAAVRGCLAASIDLLLKLSTFLHDQDQCLPVV